MKFVNLTPHALNIVTEDETRTIEPSGGIARIATSSTLVGSMDGIPLHKMEYGAIEGLPDPNGKDLFIVSGMVAAQCQRSDVFSPGELVRDDAGKPIGCRGLKVFRVIKEFLDFDEERA